MSARATRLLAVVAAILAAIRYGPVIDEPWSRYQGVIPAVYYGSIERNYQDHGFWALEGAPYLTKLPVDESRLPPNVGSFLYLRHPALTFWLLHGAVEMAGWSERTFRLVPIAFSSLSAALLVMLIAPLAGLAWAVAGLGLYLVLPMSWTYGAMINFEVCVLPAMMAALLWHLKHRSAPGSAWFWTWPLVFIAGMFDWIGLAIAPAICLYELLMPRGERRLGRAIGLAVPAALSLGSSIALMAVWRRSLTLPFREIEMVVNWAVLPEMHRATLGGWLAAQGRFWLDMFTLPVAAIAALGLPLVIRGCRSRTDELPRVALTLLVPAVLNVIIFHDHALTHGFWWYYAIPYVLCAAIVVLRPLLRVGPPVVGRTVVALAVVAMLAHATERTHSRHVAERTSEYRDAGAALNRYLRPGDLLFYPEMLGQTGFYLRCPFVEMPGGIAVTQLGWLRDQKRAGVIHAKRVVAMIPEGLTKDFTTANVESATKTMAGQRIDARTLASEIPMLAREFENRALWVFTIE